MTNMILNTRTLKKYPDDQKFKNVVAKYSYVGDRLVWTKIPGITTKAEILKEREDLIRWGRRNLRWEGDLF